MQFGAGVGILGAVTVITYAVAKITVTFTVTILLMVLPLVFLFGILAGQTRTKFKSYMAILIGLVAQRILFTMLLADISAILPNNAAVLSHIVQFILVSVQFYLV